MIDILATEIFIEVVAGLFLLGAGGAIGYVRHRRNARQKETPTKGIPTLYVPGFNLPIDVEPAALPPDPVPVRRTLTGRLIPDYPHLRPQRRPFGEIEYRDQDGE